MSYHCSEYLEFHQTELDKLTAQLKDMKRNSRLVGPSDHEDANTGWRVGVAAPCLPEEGRGREERSKKETDASSKAIASRHMFYVLGGRRAELGDLHL